MSSTSAGAVGAAADDAGATRLPLEAASPLPGRYYREPEVYRAEIDRIFSRLWVCAGREEDLARPGDFLTRRIGCDPLLLTRGGDGELRAFYNVCRHRGSLLVAEEEGSVRRGFRCPYHSWTYGTDGRLEAAPLMQDTPGFRRRDHSLVPVRLESWEGLLFLNLDEDAPPLAEELADFPDVSRYRLPHLRRAARSSYRVAANWKVLGENYGECYHCALVHPQLHRLSHYLSGGAQKAARSYTGGPMKLQPGYDTMSATGRSDRPSIPGLPAEELDRVYYYCLYPNLFLSLHRDYVLTHTLWPEGPDRTTVLCEWLFPGEAVDREGFDPADAVEFWDLTNRQDWEICERVQAGVGSRGYRPGRYQAGEACVHAFDNWYLERMEGAAG